METNQNTNQIVPLQDQRNAEKRTRFLSVASKRTDNILHNMDILKRCFDQNGYDYTHEHVAKILGAIEEKITDLRLASESGSARTPFTL